jgi:hypothetical protein
LAKSSKEKRGKREYIRRIFLAELRREREEQVRGFISRRGKEKKRFDVLLRAAIKENACGAAKSSKEKRGKENTFDAFFSQS